MRTKVQTSIAHNMFDHLRFNTMSTSQHQLLNIFTLKNLINPSLNYNLTLLFLFYNLIKNQHETSIQI